MNVDNKATRNSCIGLLNPLYVLSRANQIRSSSLNSTWRKWVSYLLRTKVNKLRSGRRYPIARQKSISTILLVTIKISSLQKKSMKIPKGYQNLYIEEEQTTQWSKEKGKKGNQRSTKHTHKTKDRVTRTPQNTRGDSRCSGRVTLQYT